MEGDCEGISRVQKGGDLCLYGVGREGRAASCGGALRAGSRLGLHRGLGVVAAGMCPWLMLGFSLYWQSVCWQSVCTESLRKIASLGQGYERIHVYIQLHMPNKEHEDT